jgi:uncharacterized protein YehS (DUF1456 family)
VANAVILKGLVCLGREGAFQSRVKDSDVVAVFELAGVTVTKSELGALFRREEHRNYHPCGDQFLRNFLRGLAIFHRRGRRI